MKIEDIVKSVSTMSDEEITSRLREIRHSRGQQKEVTVSKRPTATKEKASEDVGTALSKLSVDQLKQLALLLGGKK